MTNNDLLAEFDDLCRSATAEPWVLSQDPGREISDRIVGQHRLVFELEEMYFGGGDAQLICGAPSSCAA